MADNKVLQTRIKLKIDTLENWSKVWETFIPLAGEKILFQIPNPNNATESANGEVPEGALTNLPQVISKTGNGVIGADGTITGTTLKALPWDSALAADVAAWAKPGDTKNYISVPDLKNKVDELETNLVPEHRTLTINGTKYDPVGTADVTLTLTAGDLGINTPLDFVGITTTVLEDGKNIIPIAIKNGTSEYYPVAGDIVIVDGTDKEFLYTGSDWEELGDAAALTDAVNKLEAKTIDAGDELSWSGTLGANPKIDHDKKLGTDFTGTSNSGAATITAGSGEKTVNIPKVNVNKFGHVTGITNETVKITIPALTGGNASAADTTLVGGVSVDATKNEITVQKKTVATNKTTSALEVTGDEANIKIGFKNQNQTANDILFGDETWAGGTSANYVIFDCGTSEINI